MKAYVACGSTYFTGFKNIKEACEWADSTLRGKSWVALLGEVKLPIIVEIGDAGRM